MLQWPKVNDMSSSLFSRAHNDRQSMIYLQVFSYECQTKNYLGLKIGAPVRPQPLLAGAYEGSFAHGSKRLWSRWECEGGRVGDVRGSGEAPRAVAVAEVRSMIPKLLEPLLRRRRGRWCRSPSSRCYGCRVDDVRAPKSLLRWMWGQWCRSPLSHCCDGGRVNDVEAPRAVVVIEMGSIMLEPLRVIFEDASPSMLSCRQAWTDKLGDFIAFKVKVPACEN
jgi:hypothetical protein